MAYDPHKEDYQRLGLRFARSLDGQDPVSAARAFASFPRRFSQSRDELPQTDQDRAFHLVAEATTLIDYELPFADDKRAQALIDRGHTLLDEAIALDANCHDAVRMRAAADCTSFDEFHTFLQEGCDNVRATCEAARDQILRQATDDEAAERAALEADLAMRPYYRWLSSLAEKAVICGRNHEAIRLAEDLLDRDPEDSADVRFTCALAHAKLEDDQGLERLVRRTRHLRRARYEDAWVQLSRIALAHRRHDMGAARQLLATLVGSYPYAHETLMAQRELPEGVFARLAVAPFSEDELILAASEATVLFQEGRDDSGRGVLGVWIANELERMSPQSRTGGSR